MAASGAERGVSPWADSSGRAGRLSRGSRPRSSGDRFGRSFEPTWLVRLWGGHVRRLQDHTPWGHLRNRVQGGEGGDNLAHGS